MGLTMGDGESRAVKKSDKIGQGKAGPGRPKGMPNKTTALLKDAVLQAATNAGGKAGMVGYLQTQAIENPTAFLSLLGKTMPLQVQGGGENGAIVAEIVIRGVAAANR